MDENLAGSNLLVAFFCLQPKDRIGCLKYDELPGKYLKVARARAAEERGKKSLVVGYIFCHFLSPQDSKLPNLI